MNDKSTFKTESIANLQPSTTRVLPALTGDLSTIPLTQLLQQGYPPRPDPKIDPKGYANWVQAVTSPTNMYDTVLITDLDMQFSQYQFTLSCNSGPLVTGGWTGFVQGANGFGASTCRTGGIANYGSTHYFAYSAVTVFPNVYECIQTCATGIWGGIGGIAVPLPGNSNPVSTGLIQSGIEMASSGTSLFVAFASGFGANPAPPQGDQLLAGDEIQTWGWAATDMTSCAFSTGTTPSDNPPGAACFVFKNLTRNWTFAPMALPASSDPWFPATGDLVEEVQLNRTNAAYQIAPTPINELLMGAFWDQNDKEHLDPGGGGTDPYFYSQQNDSSGNPYNVAAWENGTVSSPADPIEFQCQNLE